MPITELLIEAKYEIQNRMLRIKELKDTIKLFKKKEPCYKFIQKEIWNLEDEIEYIKEQMKEITDNELQRRNVKCPKNNENGRISKGFQKIR